MRQTRSLSTVGLTQVRLQGPRPRLELISNYIMQNDPCRFVSAPMNLAGLHPLSAKLPIGRGRPQSAHRLLNLFQLLNLWRSSGGRLYLLRPCHVGARCLGWPVSCHREDAMHMWPNKRQASGTDPEGILFVVHSMPLYSSTKD